MGYKTVARGIRIPVELIPLLELKAEKRRVSFNQLIVKASRDILRPHKKKQ